MALISIAKLFLLIFAGVTLLLTPRSPEFKKTSTDSWTPSVVLLIFSTFALSLLWTVAPSADALGSLAKYGKLLVIVVIMALVRTKREAMFALGAFVLAQIFLLLSSWMLFAKLPVPWATSNMATTQNAVFSSYLDQGIISAVFAAICWHCKELAPGRYGRAIAMALACMALSNVFFALMGRSGHVVAIGLVSLAIMWELPKRYRPVVVLLPFFLAMGLFFGSSNVRERLTLSTTEVQSFSSDEIAPTTSSGVRLGFWLSATQIMAQHPVAGAGVGSWSTEYNRLQHTKNPAHIDIDGNGNPHHEYLLWGVQLGIPGILLLFALMLSILRDSLRMNQPCARATQSTLAALAITCLFNASIYDAQIGDFFCVLLGLLLALGLSEQRRAGSPSIPPSLPESAT